MAESFGTDAERYEPPAAVAEPFAAAFRRLVPDSPFANQPSRRLVEHYHTLYANIADAIGQSGQFTEPERWRFEWEHDYTRDQWLELLPTTGGLTQVPADMTREIQDAVGRAIDALGGHFTMPYLTLAATAARVPLPEGP